LDDPRERAERRKADDQLAAEVERIGTAEFLDKWLNQPMFSHLRPTEADLDSRRDNSAAALAGSLRMCGTGSQEPLWNRLADLTVPTLIVCGESDQKFTAIATRMLAALPQAKLEIIEGAGHAPHLEQPDAFAALLREWLDELSR
jgi:2-succinyl-6-hydroxy-2,4-cyclohexadiene-1-carboxylate synthase